LEEPWVPGAASEYMGRGGLSGKWLVVHLEEEYEAIDDLLLVLIRSVYELRVLVSCMSSVVRGMDMI
jgi:hypothetical protein